MWHVFDDDTADSYEWDGYMFARTPDVAAVTGGRVAVNVCACVSIWLLSCYKRYVLTK